MIKSSMNRQRRIQLNVAYQDALSAIYNTKSNPLLHAIAIGDRYKVQKYLDEDKNLLNKKFYQYPPLYYAVRSGHYDIVELILRKGCSLKFQDHKSTPMHCAAFYGHYTIIPLLLQYGIQTQTLNVYKDRPIQQAATKQIENLLKNCKQDKIHQLVQKLLHQKIGYTMLNIKLGGVDVKKIILWRYFDQYENYSDAFHGTAFQNLFSIAQYGLRKPGEKVDGKKIDIVEGHIPLGANFQGIKNWSSAIFLSPSIFYAAHPVYSKQVISKDQTWLPLVQAKVKNGTFTRHDHTLKYYQRSNDEPINVQWRVQVKTDQKDLIMRSQNFKDVIVVAIILVKKGFFEKNMYYEEVTNFILDSPQERKMKEYSNDQ